MNNHTKEFIQKLTSLMEEYRCEMEIDGDSYNGDPLKITLEVLNPQTFDEHYDQWLEEHPGEKYPFNHDLYSYAEYVDLGYHIDIEKLERILE